MSAGIWGITGHLTSNRARIVCSSQTHPFSETKTRTLEINRWVPGPAVSASCFRRPQSWHGVTDPPGSVDKYLNRHREDHRFRLFSLELQSMAERRATAPELLPCPADCTPPQTLRSHYTQRSSVNTSFYVSRPIFQEKTAVLSSLSVFWCSVWSAPRRGPVLWCSVRPSLGRDRAVSRSRSLAPPRPQLHGNQHTNPENV